jgi:hypothetical protein
VETPKREPPSTRKGISTMDEYESLSHTKWECKYPVVFIPKCRRKVLYEQLRQHFPKLVQPIIKNWNAVCKDSSPGALMFPTKGKGSRRGQTVPYDSTNFMERRIHPIADKLGVLRRLVTFQVMRRTVATDLQFHGTLKDAQTALRRKSSKTTGDVYMQAVPASVKAALNARTAAVFDASKSKGDEKPSVTDQQSN